MLELKNINSFYGDAHILFDINLKIEEGQLVGLFGRNGAGKTSVLRSIMGLNPPRYDGQIMFRGEDISGLPAYQIANKGIGFVPEDRAIFPNLTVKQNLIVGKKAKKNTAKWGLKEVYDYFPKLKTLENNLGCEMSGGEQQMLTVARTLMGDPDLILLDEPTEGLAPLIADHLMSMIMKIRVEHNVSMIVVEQFSPNLLDFLDVCYVMEMGRIIFGGNPHILRDDKALQQQLLGVG
ncbi:MAG TPA: ABC transporter ATP-binding protein [Syntrophales bacterium]|nr:ABC transporter ATP-binding protein [Syntrophales bacterium]